MSQTFRVRVVASGYRVVSFPLRPRACLLLGPDPLGLEGQILDVVEEVGDRHFQDTSQFEQAAGADPVGAALVLLNLLER